MNELLAKIKNELESYDNSVDISGNRISIRKNCNCFLHGFSRIVFYYTIEGDCLFLRPSFEICCSTGTPGSKIEITSFISDFFVFSAATLGASLHCYNLYYEDIFRLKSHIFLRDYKIKLSKKSKIDEVIAQYSKLVVFTDTFSWLFDVSMECRKDGWGSNTWDAIDENIYNVTGLYCETPRNDFACYQSKSSKLTLYKFNKSIKILEIIKEEADKYEITSFANGRFVKFKDCDNAKLINSGLVWLDSEVVSQLNKLKKLFKTNTKESYLITFTKIFIIFNDCVLVCQNRDFNKITEEKLKQIDVYRDKINKLIPYIGVLKFKDKINAEMFEQLAKELLAKEGGDFYDIKEFGNVNEADGGRDIECLKLMSIDEKEIKPIKVIVQCKAYKSSVSKKHVADVRDMLDYRGAQGFFLVTSSTITVGLHDYFNELKKKITYVDWWTGSDILIKLRMNPGLIKKYKELLITE